MGSGDARGVVLTCLVGCCTAAPLALWLRNHPCSPASAPWCRLGDRGGDRVWRDERVQPRINPPAGAARHRPGGAGARRQGGRHGAGGAAAAATRQRSEPARSEVFPPLPAFLNNRRSYRMALLQYERILGKAALGRGPAEHWAHADYGWLLYQEGDIQGARQHLEDALKVATSSGCIVTDSQVGRGAGRLACGLGRDSPAAVSDSVASLYCAGCSVRSSATHLPGRHPAPHRSLQLAEHHYRLGEVYWKMRGRYRTEKQFAYTQVGRAAIRTVPFVVTSTTSAPAELCRAWLCWWCCSSSMRRPWRAMPRRQRLRRSAGEVGAAAAGPAYRELASYSLLAHSPLLCRSLAHSPTLLPWAPCGGAGTSRRWRARRSRRCGATSALWLWTPPWLWQVAARRRPAG